VKVALTNARQKLSQVANYQLLVLRQERVNDALQPEEKVLISIRQEPWAVRLEWPEGPNKGREVLYSPTANNGLMCVKMVSPIPVPPVRIAPDNPIAVRNSRHPIREAGLTTILDRVESALDQQMAGLPPNSPPALEHLGLETPPGGTQPVLKLRRVAQNQEVWVTYIDPTSGMPVYIEATTLSGELLERYRYQEIRFDVDELRSEAAFDADTRMPSPTRGFLSRISQAAAAAANASGTPPPATRTAEPVQPANQ
jgi:hypothetical protein